jgi:diadenosine tetraphosphatase ApaH/serine/threonine PP2A family protein phosphatase
LRIAALYDVHAMPHALAAVLDEVQEASVDARHVRGNCEREPGPWDRAQLDAPTLDRLAGLPVTLSLGGVLFGHSAPDDDSILITAATPDEVLEAAFAPAAEPMVVVGHTHHQFDRRAGDRRIVNAGSVGMPYEDDVAAFWALEEDGEPSFRRTRFDVERAAAEIGESGWPPAAEFVAENLLAVPSRAEAIDHFERLRTA